MRPGASKDDPYEVRQFDPGAGEWSPWMEQAEFVGRTMGEVGHQETARRVNEMIRADQGWANDDKGAASGAVVARRPTEEPLEDRVRGLADYLIAHPKTRLMDLAASSTSEGMRYYSLARQLLKLGRLFEHPTTKVLSFYEHRPNDPGRSVPVRILVDIKLAIEEEDMEARAGDLVSLPANMARTLIAKGAAESIGTPATRSSAAMAIEPEAREAVDSSEDVEGLPGPEPKASEGGEGLPGRSTSTAILESGPCVPQRLRDPRIHFIRVKPLDKRPDEGLGWPKVRRGYDDPQLVAHLERGGNYGVLTGEGLAVIDADSPDVREAVLASLPPTFTVRTGREGGEGRHFYYWCSNLDKPLRLECEGTANGKSGDVKFTGGQVIGPGSVHPSGTRYEILEDRPIATVAAEQIRFALRGFLPSVDADTPEELEGEMPDGEGLDQLRIEDVVPLDGLTGNGSKYQGPCPWHGSDTGSNFTIDTEKNVWHCFRHDSGGGPLQAIAVMEGVIECAESRKGALRGERFLEIIEHAETKHGLVRQARAASGAKGSPKKGGKKISAALALVMMAKQRGATEFFHDQARIPFARIDRGGHREVRAVKEPEFYEWLAELTYDAEGLAPSEYTAKRARDTLAVLALRGEERPVYVAARRAPGSVLLRPVQRQMAGRPHHLGGLGDCG